ncbi:MAG: TOBE domain-containing protein [Helicobacteraceae bacterium]|jgi:molybdate transport system regulatory protein|nr:TOBE domain-containing protein [Helicobacteraceae bacterium]
MMLGCKVWVDVDNKPYLGESRIELLKAIERHGSINAAAKAVNLSYKAAWDSIDAMNNLSPKPLVLRTVGGKGGGGTLLTDEAFRVIEAFDTYRRQFNRLLSLLSIGGGLFSALGAAQRITMNTSARNQLFGVVSEIQRGAVNSKVVLTLRSSAHISAIITNDSVEEMKLKVGDDAYALIKASWIILSREKPGKISAGNALEGSVIEVINGMVNAEVKLLIAGGNVITAIVTTDAQKELDIKVGDKSWALFSASNVIIAA